MKKFFALLACFALTLTLAGCGGNNNDNGGADSNGMYSSGDTSGIGSDIESKIESGMDDNQSMTTAANDAKITAEQATATALSHAGITEADAERLNVELERDDGVLKYDVDFYKSNVEYNYDIDATTGEILSYDSDVD